MSNDTIVAIATASGYAGIGIVRLSGIQALAIAHKITDCQTLLHKQITHCNFYASDGQMIDAGLAIYFQSPHSFTGEDVVELQAHGSPIVLNALVTHAIQLGCRIAEPGEFTKRGYLNNKFDLVQAESIADLIHAQSLASAKSAVKSLQGGFSAYIQAITDKLITLRTFIEATLDFPEEDIEFINQARIKPQLDIITHELTNLLSNAKQGVILNNGANVVIIGRPNVGKSSLLNQLAGDEIAIVTDIPGTTRDLIKERILINGISLNIIDTAGIRVTDDQIEQLGINKALHSITHADLCLILSDASNMCHNLAIDDELLAKIPTTIPRVVVYNKIDLCSDTQLHNLMQQDTQETHAYYVSAKAGTGITALKQAILASIGLNIENIDVFSARTRHLDAIRRTIEHINTGHNNLYIHNLELLAEELRYAHTALGEITGTFTTEDLLGKIFNTFCIGK